MDAVELLTIGDLTQKYRVSSESLRNWEKQGLLPPAKRTPGGHRRYSSEHVAAIEKLLGINQAAPQGGDVTHG
jgi:DNA-binding transcriptional MerR regulator